MSVTVRTPDEDITHDEGVTAEPDNYGNLMVYAENIDRQIAVYSPGHWIFAKINVNAEVTR